jgi:HSP20 family protein
MAFRDLIPWSRTDDRLPKSLRSEQDSYPILSLQREMNRLFDDVFRGFGGASLSGLSGSLDWPHVELGETDTRHRGASRSR